ncbi:MAG TPA: acyltransferase family protein [Streptosporangiaceae bacterium]|nr:acyltransferase family protein [Streptosporangiaceae bacterium]
MQTYRANEMGRQGGSGPAPAALGGRGGDHGERNFRPDIQGLRALAVTMVLIYHLYPSLLPGGFVGVDVFFVISGYLITGQLWRGVQRTGKVALVEFWGRRARRLVPAAALVLAVTWLLSRLVLPATQLANTAQQIRASALYFQNWQLAHDAVDYLKSSDAASPVQHFWSLSVEEQFYLVWPLLFLAAGLLARRHSRRAWHVTAACLAAVLVVGSLAYSVYDTRTDPQAAYFVTTTRMWELGMGGLLALMPERLSSAVGRHGWLGWAGLCMVLASPFALRGTAAFPGAVALLPTAGAVLLIAGGSAHARLGPARLTSLRAMVFLGGISYSLYLWHWPIIVLYTSYFGRPVDARSGPALAALAVLLSWLTKMVVEDRVRLSRILAGHGWRSVSTALAAVVPAGLVSAYLFALPAGWNGALGANYPGAAALAHPAMHVRPEPVRPPLATLQAAIPQYWQQGCLDYSAAPKVCVYGDVHNPVLTVALVGDSVAGNWFPALEQIAQKRHWKLVTDLHASCTWTATVIINRQTNAPYTKCHAWGVTVLHDLLTKIRPDVVITSELAERGSVSHPRPGPQAYADVAAGMAQYWRQLEESQISVVAMRETPTINTIVPGTCVARYGPSSRACDVPTSAAVLPDPPTELAARLLGGTAKVIDMTSLICGPTTCSPVVGNVMVYMDRDHLTSSYSTTLAPFLEPRLLHSVPALTQAG